jgi:hypothetical protein
MQLVKAEAPVWFDPKQSSPQKYLDEHVDFMLDLFQQQGGPDFNAVAWTDLFHKYLPDHLDKDGRLYLGLRRAPAAKANHHAYEGGLLAHLIEMWRLHKQVLGPNLLGVKELELAQITDGRVLTAILSHDLHKGIRTYIWRDESMWRVERGNDDSDGFMTHEMKSIAFLMSHHIILDEIQMNAFCWAEGGFSTIKPKYTSILAKYCYILDELSGNVLARVQQRDFDSVKGTRLRVI